MEFSFKAKRRGRILNPSLTNASSHDVDKTLFQDDEEEEQANQAFQGDHDHHRALVNLRIKHQQLAAKRKQDDTLTKAVQQDPNAFEYDTIYESIKPPNSSSKDRSMEREKSSKYIQQLMANTKRRQIDYERAKERKVQKEQEEEEKLQGKASQVFLTAAYKAKLEQRKEWEKQEAERAEREARDDVRKKTDLTGFYSRFLKQVAPDANDDEHRNIMAESELPSNTAGSQVKPVRNRDASFPAESMPRDVKVYRPGEMKRKREEQESMRKAPPSKVSRDDLEQARKRALERAKARRGKV